MCFLCFSRRGADKSEELQKVGRCLQITRQFLPLGPKAFTMCDEHKGRVQHKGLFWRTISKQYNLKVREEL